MNEEFAIKLKTILDESSFSKAKQQLAEFSKTAQETASKSFSPATNTTAQIDAESYEVATNHAKELEQTLSRIGDLQGLLDSPFGMGMSKEEILAVEVEIEKLWNKVAKLTQTTDTEEVQKGASNIVEDLKQASKQAVRFGLALIGVQGVYTSIRKAMTTWLAQNDELQNKLNACWYALGSLFAPVLEWLVNIFVKLVSVVDALAKALGFAGINMDKYGKKGKNAQKQLAGFDEINNISKRSGAENPFGDFGTELANKFPNLANMVKANAEILKLIGIGASFGIGVALLFTGHVASGLGLILASGMLAIPYLKENWDYIVEKVGGVKNAIAGLLSGFSMGLGVVLLFSGHPALGLGLLLAGLTVSAVLIDWNVLPDTIREKLGIIGALVGGSLLAIGLIVTLFNPALGLAMMLGGGLLSYISYTKVGKEGALAEYTTSELDKTTSAVSQGMGNVTSEMLAGLDQMKFDNQSTWAMIDLMTGNGTDLMGSLIKAGLDSVKEWFRNTWNNIKTTASEFWNNLKQGIANFFTNAGNTISNKVRSILNSYIISPINRVINWINSCLNSSYGGLNILGKQVIAPFSVSLGNLRSIPQLEVGTNFVPNDMLAMLHQGEAVVPKAFNEDQYSNSEETNELLRQLIEVVDSKEFRTYISQNEIGKTAVNYINQQSRIMGGSIL